jgi:hypothetical protein
MKNDIFCALVVKSIGVVFCLSHLACNEGGSDSDLNNTADSDMNDSSAASSDEEIHDSEAPDPTVENAKICDAATSEIACNQAARSLIPFSDDCQDCWQSCQWTSFDEVVLANGDNCVWGDTRGYCVLVSSGEGSSLKDIKGCGSIDGQPAFVKDDESVFVGLSQSPREIPGLKVQPCRFTIQGGKPAECNCLCDWPADPQIQCNWSADVCFDSSTGLHWPARLDGKMRTGPVVAAWFCGTLELGGYSDWRLPNIDELASLLRGCPDCDADIQCRVSEDCNTLDCADAPCSHCETFFAEGETPDGCPYSTCPNPSCEGCVQFGEGPCAAVAPDEWWEGPGYKGCFRVANMDWICSSFWSNTRGEGPNPRDYPRYWGIDFINGARFLSALYADGQGTTPRPRPFACVRP